MTRVVLITGANSGDARAAVNGAREMIGERIGKVVAQSAVWESEPWGDVSGEVYGWHAEGKEEAAPFLNQVLVVETDLTPDQLLAATQNAEAGFGRRRPEHFCREIGRTAGGGGINRKYFSRTMDIDILFYGDRIVDTPRLKIPHPLMGEREFVLRPLSEVLPDHRHPVTGKTAAEMLEELTGQ